MKSIHKICQNENNCWMWIQKNLSPTQSILTHAQSVNDIELMILNKQLRIWVRVLEWHIFNNSSGTFNSKATEEIQLLSNLKDPQTPKELDLTQSVMEGLFLKASEAIKSFVNQILLYLSSFISDDCIVFLYVYVHLLNFFKNRHI